MSMLDKVNSAVEIKADISDAIEAKGVSMTGVTFGGYASKIAEISTGVDPSDANATDNQVLTGRTYYARNSTKHTGGMNYAVVTSGGSACSLTEGYYAGGTVATYADTSLADATPADVASGKKFYAVDNTLKTGTATIGMPSIPASFTDLSLNTSYTASGDGWIKYKISYYWGGGFNATLTIGSRTYQITASGEDVDMGWVEMEGIAPVYSGEAFQLTTTGSASSHAYLKVACL